MPAPLFMALLGVAFCAWSASGNALNVCVTSGCSLFQDSTVGGISMWWVGVAGFALLALLSLSGRPLLGLWGAGFALVLDGALLTLMLLTAPCVGCLVVGLLFALTYAAFRHAVPRRDTHMPRSNLLVVWTVLCIINVAGIARAELRTWPVYGGNDSATHMYFSPSCSACREGIIALAGKANVAFFPVNEDDNDVMTIALMTKALAGGATMQSALTSALAVERPTREFKMYSLEMLWLRFRLLCNKAHVFAAGGQLPYFEFRGLPAALVKDSGVGKSRPSSTGALPSQDYALPIDTGVAGSCGGPNAVPCP
ncbi:MAG: hypothetical protein RRY29_04975 [Desulfovibrionaceae bacterium]